LQETTFSALFLFFIAAMLFVLLYKSIGRFSVGPKGVEFEWFSSTGRKDFLKSARIAVKKIGKASHDR
jgi:hypothetical protein